MINHSYAISLSALCFLSLAVSCQDEELGYTADQIAYRTNFEKAFGKISDVPTWDFSSYNLARLGLQGGPTVGMTRANGNCNYPDGGNAIVKQNAIKQGGYYTVEQNTLNWLNNLLKESDSNNKGKGEAFKLVKPEDGKDFLIIPIYQGHSGMSWDLHLVASNPENELKDYMIWSKSDNLFYTLNYGADEGEEYFYNTIDYNEDLPQSDDFSGWNDNGTVKLLKLGRAFNQKTSNTTEAKIRFEVPAGKILNICLGNNVYGGDDSWDWKNSAVSIYLDNSGSATSAYTPWIDVISLIGDYPDTNYNFGLKVGAANTCGFKSSDSDDMRVKIFNKYNGRDPFVMALDDCDGHGTNDVSYASGHTINRRNVKAKPIRIDCSMIQDEFYLYLDITKGMDDDNNGHYATEGMQQRSDNHMMIALDETLTTGSDHLISSASTLKNDVLNILTNIQGIDENCEYFVVGCEDASLAGTDNDYNDVVFLVVGLSKAPKIMTEFVQKRYMIEDLGSTFDFDFNDIVIDVTQAKYRVPGTSTKTDKTTATIRHLCGTIPFEIKIGNTILNDGETSKFGGCNRGAATGEVGCNPSSHSAGSNGHSDAVYRKLEFAIDGWDPSTNNITVTTWPKQAGWNKYDYEKDNHQDGNGLSSYNKDGAKSYGFPQKGDFPYIIACDQTVMWMKEGVNVPKDWFQTWPDEYWQNTGQDKPNGGSGDPTPTPTYITENNYTLGTPISVTYQSDDTGWNNYVRIGSNLSGVQVGDKIIATISNVQSGAKLLFKKTPSSGWGDISSVDPLATTATEVTLEVTAENIDDIKSGVAVQGLGFTLTEIQLVRELSLGENSGILGGYDNNANKPQIDAALNKGDKIKIEYTVTSSSGTIQVFERTGEDWSWSNQKDFNNLTSSGSITCTMVSDDIHGIAIQGENITITKVSKIN